MTRALTSNPGKGKVKKRNNTLITHGEWCIAWETIEILKKILQSVMIQNASQKYSFISSSVAVVLVLHNLLIFHKNVLQDFTSNVYSEFLDNL